jgi:predicted acylesterase/phospholipase RssA
MSTTTILVLLLFCAIAIILMYRVAKSPPKGHGALRCRGIASNEIEALYSYGFRKFGSQISDASTVKMWFDKNPNIFEIVTKTKTGEADAEDIEGYLCALPLTDTGRRGVAKGAYTGATIPTDEITAPNEKASAVYIGGVAGESEKAKLKVMLRLKTVLGLYDSASVIYTRPITEEGLRWVVRSGFTRVDGQSDNALGYLYKQDVLTKAERKAITSRPPRKTRFFQTCYGVFQGGGCRGAAYVGAYAEAVDRGVRFVEVAGTSAGSIIAVLIAAGASPLQLRQIIGRLDFRQLLSEPSPVPKSMRWFLKLPLHILSRVPHKNLQLLAFAVLRNGRYSTAKLNNWLETELKGLLSARVDISKEERVRFRHLQLPVSVVAADIRERRVHVWSSQQTPEDEVSEAVCASCSIPFFFQPTQEKYVDGGTLSNLPSFVFNRHDKGRRLALPVLAFSLRADFERSELLSGFGLPLALVNTVIDGSQELQQKLMQNVHNIVISTGAMKATDFDHMTPDAIGTLIKAGQLATRTYIDLEVDKINLKRPSRVETSTAEETYSTLAERLILAKHEVIIALDDIAWIDELDEAVLCARIKGVRVCVICEGHALSGRAQRRREVLESMGCTVMAAGAMQFRGCLFDWKKPELSFAFLPSEEGTLQPGTLYSGRKDGPAIAYIVSACTCAAEEAPTPELVLAACSTSEKGRCLSLVRSAAIYDGSDVEMQVQLVPLEQLRSLTKYVQEHRYKQAFELVSLYEKRKETPYTPMNCKCGSRGGLLIPPIVEQDKATGHFYLIDGSARALACKHRELEAVECLVVTGVGRALPSPSRFQLSQLEIVCMPITREQRFSELEPENFRQIPHSVYAVV